MPKTAQEKAHVRRQTEARLQPDKDRTAHNNARGRKASRSHHDQDLDDAELDRSFHEMAFGSDRVSAIMGAALVEQELYRVLSLSVRDSKLEKTLFIGRSAPLASFRDRILIAGAFGIVRGDLADEMDVIRSVRNDFAHALRSIDFTVSKIVTLCEKLPDRESLSSIHVGKPVPKISPARHRFEGACWHAAIALLKKQNEMLEIKRKGLELAALLQKGFQPAFLEDGRKDSTN